MSEEEKNEEQQCFVCGSNGDDRVLLNCRHEQEEKCVCVRCLPMLIHGG